MRNSVIGTVLTATLALSVNGICEDATPMVNTGKNGKLIYSRDTRGNRIPDFSRCGYMGGGVTIPTPVIVKKLSPVKGDTDDTARIQAAIDEASARKPNAS